MFDELTAIGVGANSRRRPARLVIDILDANREQLLTLPAATRNHHAFVGGWLEHVLSVTRTCVYLADKYDELLSRHAAAARQGAGRGRRHPARHRQAARVSPGAARGRLHGRRGADRPHARKAATSSAKRPPAAACRPKCCCGWSTSSSPISGCPNGARRSRR